MSLTKWLGATTREGETEKECLERVYQEILEEQLAFLLSGGDPAMLFRDRFKKTVSEQDASALAEQEEEEEERGPDTEDYEPLAKEPGT